MLWIWFIIGFILLLGVAVVFLRWAGKPIPYRGLELSNTEKFLNSFLQQLDTGSVFVLERESGAGFLQLAIREHKGDRLVVEFGIPDAEWSREHFDSLQAVMRNAGYSNQIESNASNNAVPRFLRVLIKGSRNELTAASLLVLQLAAKELEFKTDERYTLRMSGSASSEYQQELATQLEQLPTSGQFGHLLAKLLRRGTSS